LDPLAWLERGQGRLVKVNVARSIYQIPWEGGVIYLKVSRVVGLRGWLREALRLPKALSECDNAERLQQLGIDTIEVLACGCDHRYWPGSSYLLTRGCSAAVPLHDFLMQAADSSTTTALTPQQRRRLAQCLGVWVAHLHNQGVNHPDLHPGNVLIEWTDPQADPRFLLIDLHDVRFASRPLSWSESRDNLVLLNRWFQLRASRTDRLRFWRAYSQHRWPASLGHLHRQRISELEVATLRSNQQLWQARRRRYSRPSRHCRRIQWQQCYGLAVRDLPDTTVQQWLENADDWLAGRLQGQPGRLLSPDQMTAVEWRTLKSGGKAVVVAIRLANAQQSFWVVLKRFALKRWYEPLQNLLRWPPAWRAWLHGHALLDRGLPTPRPLAVWHRYRWGLPAEGYLVTEYVAEAVPLQAQPQRVRLQALARLLRLLHDRGLSHRDLKGDNILVRPDGQPLLIDLVGVSNRRRVSTQRRLKDLMRLNVSFWNHPQVRASVRLRLLWYYAAVMPRDPGGYPPPPALWKRWWKWIGRASLAKWRRWQRMGRLTQICQRG
jgi:tRNA A-37 threonylcarbamoyl transferase component Bud32